MATLKETGQIIKLEDVINKPINHIGQHQHARISITYYTGNVPMNVYIEALWPKYFCRGKPISRTHSEWVPVALDIQ